MFKSCAQHLFWLTLCVLLVVSTAEVDDSANSVFGLNTASNLQLSTSTLRTPSSTVNSTTTISPKSSSSSTASSGSDGGGGDHRNHHNTKPFGTSDLAPVNHSSASSASSDYSYDYYDSGEDPVVNSPRVSASLAGGGSRASGSGHGLYDDDEDSYDEDEYDYYDYDDDEYYDEYYDETSTPDYGVAGSDSDSVDSDSDPDGSEPVDDTSSYDDTYDDYDDEAADEYEDDGDYDDDEDYYDDETGDTETSTDSGQVVSVDNTNTASDDGVEEDDDDDYDDYNDLPGSIDDDDDHRGVYDDVGDDEDQLGKEPFNGVSSFLDRPGMLAAIIGGAVVGLFCAILLVMLIVYRVRKKDEGSYMLDEPKRSLTGNGVSRNYNKEFYA